MILFLVCLAWAESWLPECSTFNQTTTFSVCVRSIVQLIIKNTDERYVINNTAKVFRSNNPVGFVARKVVDQVRHCFPGSKQNLPFHK